MDMDLKQAITTVIDTLKSGGVTQASIARLAGIQRPQLNTYLRQSGSLSHETSTMIAKVLLSEVERLSINPGQKPFIDYKTVLATEISILRPYAEQSDKPICAVKQQGTLHPTVSLEADILPLIKAVLATEVLSVSISTLVKLQEIRARLKYDLTPELVKALLDRM